MRRLIVPIFAAAALLAPAASQAAPRPGDLWATVNICDTVRHPDRMGVRASMPGTGRRGNMYMRFRAQFFDRSADTWTEVRGSGLSRWIYVGSSRFKTRQAGYTFAFNAPSTGSSFVMRGRVEYQWQEYRRSRRTHRLRNVIVRRAQANTRAGHPSTVGADPQEYSASLCEVR